MVSFIFYEQYFMIRDHEELTPLLLRKTAQEQHKIQEFLNNWKLHTKRTIYAIQVILSTFVNEQSSF